MDGSSGGGAQDAEDGGCVVYSGGGSGGSVGVCVVCEGYIEDSIRLLVTLPTLTPLPPTRTHTRTHLKVCTSVRMLRRWTEHLTFGGTKPVLVSEDEVR